MGIQLNARGKVLKLFAAGIVVGVLLTLVTMGGYHAAGSPAFCTSCHSMKEVGATWKASRHKQFACIECHLPDRNIAVQVAYKTKAGLHDLYHETLRAYPASISTSPEARKIASGNCMRCHFSTIGNTFMVEGGADCLKCHHGVVHGTGMGKGGIKVE